MLNFIVCTIEYISRRPFCSTVLYAYFAVECGAKWEKLLNKGQVNEVCHFDLIIFSCYFIMWDRRQRCRRATTWVVGIVAHGLRLHQSWRWRLMYLWLHRFSLPLNGTQKRCFASIFWWHHTRTFLCTFLLKLSKD